MNDLNKQIMQVIMQNLCVGCGLCSSIAGEKNIRIDLNNNGQYLPNVLNNLSCFPDGIKLEDFCPGLKIIQSFQCSTVLEKIIGPYISSEKGFSTDNEIRFISSSGGIITSICLYLLEKKYVQGVVHIGKSKIDPYYNKTYVSKNREELLENSGSRYSPSSPLINIKDTLERVDGKICVVGRPCDIYALKRMINIYPNLSEKLFFTIAFFCAGTPTYKGTDDILNRINVTKPLKDLRYRGNGWPGNFYARSEKNEGICSYAESWGKILSKNLLLRCKICPDGVGMFADLSVGDLWEEKNGLPSFEEKDGYSLVLTRTKLGYSIYHEAIKNKYIESELISAKIIYNIQKYQINRKKLLGARLLAFRIKFKKYPKIKGFSLLRLSVSISLKNNLSNFWGMLKRI